MIKIFMLLLILTTNSFAKTEYGLVESDRDVIQWLFKKAQKYSGIYSNFPDLNHVKFFLVSDIELSQIACEHDPENCRGIAGLFDTQTKTIFLRADLNPTQDKIGSSFLLHEIVHYLQSERYTEDEMFATCERLYATEQLAYAAQDKFLKDEGEFFRAGNFLRFFLCN